VPANWLQLSVAVAAEASDALANFLIERGSPGVVIKKQEVRGYFAEPFDLALRRRELRTFLGAIEKYHPGSVKHPAVSWRIVKEEDWNRRWRKFIKPQKVGKAFWITPPWAPVPKFRRRQVITIEPGMAFGTGSHATTRGCLEFAEKVAGKLSGRPFTALDVGTGSAILSIALAKLGAKKIAAIDNDPVALQVARENVRLNGAEKQVVVLATDLRRIRKLFSLVVANITAETIVELGSALTKRVDRRGFLILSGILNGKAERVIARIAAGGFRLVARKREGQWTSLLWQRK
jgi:ribosomal protein L11 methyltransferase